MATTTVQHIRTDASWLRLTQVGIVTAVVGILVLGVSMLSGQVADSPGAEGSGDFRGVVDYVATAAALPIGLGLLLATLGFHRLQGGRDGRLGTVGVWVYGVCTIELVVQCMVSVAVGAELIWGPAYPLCALGLMVGLALLAAGSWRVGLLPRWMLGGVAAARFGRLLPGHRPAAARLRGLPAGPRRRADPQDEPDSPRVRRIRSAAG